MRWAHRPDLPLQMAAYAAFSALQSQASRRSIGVARRAKFGLALIAP